VRNYRASADADLRSLPVFGNAGRKLCDFDSHYYGAHDGRAVEI
jgi:hypothetical protein